MDGKYDKFFWLKDFLSSWQPCLNRRTGDTRGFAFVRFFNKHDAEDAMDDLDGRWENHEIVQRSIKNEETTFLSMDLDPAQLGKKSGSDL